MSRAFVVPRASAPSGGHTYNARVLQAWRQTPPPGGVVERVELDGAWPTPDDDARGRLAQVLREHEVTLVDGLVACCSPEEIAQATRAGHRVVVLVHLPLPAEVGLDEPEPAELAAAEAAALAAATRVVATSRWAADDLFRRYGARAAVASPGADPRPIATGSEPPHLLVLASLTRRKNHGTLVRALATLDDLPWTAAFVGPWSDDPAEAAQVAVRLQAAPPGRIEMPGPLVGTELDAQWARTDLLVLPSLAETFGLVVTEAHARGIPTIVAAGTGAVEALYGTDSDAPPDDTPVDVPGAAVDPTDPGAFAEALRHWLLDPSLRSQWRERARLRREHARPWAATARDLRKEME